MMVLASAISPDAIIANRLCAAHGHAATAFTFKATFFFTAR